MEKNMKRKGKKRYLGFTLVEMLIVIIVLGILAMIIIPQITVSTEDAKLSTLQTNLHNMRAAVELYYAQHNMIYPGMKAVDGGGGDNNAAAAATAFADQLSKYSEASGKADKDSATLTAPIFGPYLKGGLPVNPFNNKSSVVCDVTTTDITAKTASGTNAGWKFYTKTGVLLADDGTHDAY